jgi:hypothetical protein
VFTVSFIGGREEQRRFRTEVKLWLGTEMLTLDRWLVRLESPWQFAAGL